MGCTICLGEVAYARKQGFEVMPIDMREIEYYYEENSLDCIVAHCCLQFIALEERTKLQESVHKILKPERYFIVVDYKFNQHTGLGQVNNQLFNQIECKLEDYPTMGNLLLLQKCVTNSASM